VIKLRFSQKNHRLITPFDSENLKPAGYELTVGDEYFKSGEYLPLKDRLTLLPFEVAVIKTGEIICLPRYLIARWNIRVKHAYQGLLWVGGPQVDPGYVGHLFCPIYNLSDRPVSLSLGEPLALMDFQKTTAFDTSKPHDDEVVKRYVLPPKRVILEDYGIDDLKSALFTRIGQRLEEFEGSIRNLEGRFVTFTQLSFAIFGLMIPLLSPARFDRYFIPILHQSELLM
jgi:deoxycytidine triphosphate deaminase